MPRTRTVPDATVFAAVCRILADEGDRAVSFSAVGRATRLAAPTLVQRYGSRGGMVRAAIQAAWDDLEAATAATLAADKGPQGLLKALNAFPPDPTLLDMTLRDPALRPRASAWRDRIELALAERLGGGDKAREGAAILFAAWQGQRVWQAAGAEGFRLKDAVKRLD